MACRSLDYMVEERTTYRKTNVDARQEQKSKTLISFADLERNTSTPRYPANRKSESSNLEAPSHSDECHE